MVVLGSAEFLLKISGLGDALKATGAFQDSVIKTTTKVNEGTKSMSVGALAMVGAFAGAGAAIGNTFMALIRTSAVATSLMGAFGATFGAIADIALASLIPVFMPLLKLLGDFATWLQQAPPWVQEFIGVMILAVPAIIMVSVAIAALTAVSLPIILVILAIAAAIAVIIIIWRNWGGIVAWFQNVVIKPFASYFQIHMLGIQVVLKLLGDVFKAVWTGMSIVLKWFMDTWILPFVKSMTFWWSILMTGLTILVKFFQTAWNLIVAGVRWFANLYLGIWETIINGVIGGINLFLQGFEAFVNFFIGGVNAIVDGINAVASAVGLPTLGRLGTISIGLISPVKLPRLATGGEVLQTGAAVVHRGEIVGKPSAFAPPVNITISNTIQMRTMAEDIFSRPGFKRELEDLFRSLGDMAGQRTLETIRRRA
jgi:hypothetical protein